MPRRLALLAVLAIALAALILLLPGRSTGDHAATGGGGAWGRDAAPQLPPGAAPEFGEDGIVRSGASDASGADGEDAAAAGDAAYVLLRVLLRIADPDGEPRVPPRCRGWIVRAQTWSATTRSIVRHEARTDARGIALFRFPGATHVDWVACLPADEAWGESFHEPHEDLSPGTVETWTITLAAAGAAKGRVLDDAGLPAAGAIVHVYQPNWSYGLDNWTPGYAQAVCGADGSFRFDRLGEGDWIFGVEPGVWLQISPELGAGTPGEDRATVRAGKTTELGVFRVIAGTSATVLVVDGAGTPIPGASVWAEAIVLDDSSLTLAEERKGQEIAFLGSGIVMLDSLKFANSARLGATREFRARSLFLADQADALTSLVWAAQDRREAGLLLEPVIQDALVYESFGFQEPEPQAPEPQAPEEPEQLESIVWQHPTVRGVTREDGMARLALPPGRWRFGAWVEVLEGQEMPELEATVPGGMVVLRMPLVLGGFGGRLVGADGEPVAGAHVWLNHQDGASVDAVQSDAEGRFRFEGVPAMPGWELLAAHEDRVTCSWGVDLSSRAEAAYFLPPRAPLDVRFVTPDGAPLEQDGAYCTLRTLAPTRQKAPPGALAGLPQWESEDGLLHTDHPDRARLLAGEYELTLAANAWTGTWNASGPIYEPRELGRWIVHTREEPWILTAEAVRTDPAPEDWAVVRGRVTDAASGAPVPGAGVWAWDGDQQLGGSSSDENGDYEFWVRPGPGTLLATGEGWLSQVRPLSSFAPGEQRHDFRLEAGEASLLVTLLDRDGAALPTCEVHVLPGGSVRWFTLSVEGPFLLENLPLGPLTLECRMEGVEIGRAHLQVAPGPMREVEARLERTLEQIQALIGNSR